MTKVLVVDDEASISGAVSYALRREGYTMETAAYGQEALDQVEVFKPDVMVLDVMMQAKRIRGLPQAGGAAIAASDPYDPSAQPDGSCRRYPDRFDAKGI